MLIDELTAIPSSSNKNGTGTHGKRQKILSFDERKDANKKFLI